MSDITIFNIEVTEPNSWGERTALVDARVDLPRASHLSHAARKIRAAVLLDDDAQVIEPPESFEVGGYTNVGLAVNEWFRDALGERDPNSAGGLVKMDIEEAAIAAAH